jgi:casein kinase 1
VEDGEYDWMKIPKNDKKGGDWDRPGALHNPNVRPGASNMELHTNSRGGTGTPHQSDPRNQNQLTMARLNAAQPPTPPIKQPKQGRPNVPGALATPRAGAGGYADMATPTGSTQAQFQNSTQNLPQRSIPPHQANMAQPQPNAGRSADGQQPTGVNKFMRMLCCG